MNELSVSRLLMLGVSNRHLVLLVSREEPLYSRVLCCLCCVWTCGSHAKCVALAVCASRSRPQRWLMTEVQYEETFDQQKNKTRATKVTGGTGVPVGSGFAKDDSSCVANTNALKIPQIYQ